MLALLVMYLYCFFARAAMPSGEVIISLWPTGQLAAPENFGDHCTLVDVASVLNFYGVPVPQALLAERLGTLVNYSATSGVPWWAYVGLPGHRPLLDTATERVARDAGRPVEVHTELGLDFRQATAAIIAHRPLVLNMWHAPDGTPNHSLLAYGADTRWGRSLLLAIDPNSGQSYWIGASSLWSQTVTSTYIVPLGVAPPTPAI
jgi:hypothetical protein